MEWFSLFAVSFAYLSGLGFLLWVALSRFFRPRALSAGDLGIVVAVGVVIHYLLTLCTHMWEPAGPYYSWLALLGWVGFGAVIFRQRKILLSKPRPKWSWLFYSLIVAVYFLKILFDPLWAHDARSIWFFAAKILYFAHGFGDAGLWQFPDSYLNHFDYPKLIAVHAAHLAAKAGYWNEHIPKLALFWLFLPAVCFLSALRTGVVSRLFFFAAFLGVPGSFLWTGYMDGYLAIYAALGVLFYLQAKDTGEIRDSAISVVSFAIMTALKQEGVFFLIAFLCAATVYDNRGFKRYFVYIPAFLPWLAWKFVSRELHFTAWPDFLSGDVFGRIYGRIVSGEVLNPILSSLLWDGKLLMAGIPLVACLLFARRFGPRFSLNLPLWVGGLYGGVLLSIYMVTPLDLLFHIGTSVERAALPVVFMVLSAVGLWIRDAESRPR